MSEKLTCPFCEHSIDVDMVDMAGLWKEKADLASRLGSLWRLANEYLDSFRSAPDSRLSLKRRVRHLTAIAHLWETGEFEFKGRRYRLDRAVIRDALAKVCEAGKFGFSDHNYLKVIMVKNAERVSAEGLTAKEEAAREEKRGLRVTEQPVGATPRGCPDGSRACPDPDKEEFKKRIKDITQNIGRRMP
jgi:hypothetical protein